MKRKTFFKNENGILIVHKHEKILPFARAWMDLETIRLCEISQVEKDKPNMISLTCVF